jgi:hypothetical protein
VQNFCALNRSSRFALCMFRIEDPFETHYDVAHVIKGAQMAYLRKELLVRTACCLFQSCLIVV